MDLNTYQEAALSTAIYPGQGTWLGLLYVMLGLGEAGELQGKAKKILRDDNFEVTEERREAMVGELGDVLWYVALAAKELGYDLDEVASRNVAKLSKRQTEGTLQGSGDNR